jgi:hypothetical protein
MKTRNSWWNKSFGTESFCTSDTDLFQPCRIPNRLRTVESTVGFNPISKAVKCVSATPAVLIVHTPYDILTEDTVTLVVFEAEFASGQCTIHALSTAILYRPY